MREQVCVELAGGGFGLGEMFFVVGFEGGEGLDCGLSGGCGLICR